jgi:integrase/recombinase XerD
MSTLRDSVESYIALRRSLGFKLREPSRLLRHFVSFLEEQGITHITTKLALRWAQQPDAVQPAYWAKRLGVVRQFAKHCSATDPNTEVIPLGLLPHRYRRRAPYLYTEDEISRLIRAARQLPSVTGLRGWTYSTLLGLLAVSGIRSSEVLALDRDAVNLSEGVLTILRTKFGKSRFVPLHSSAIQALRNYAQRRDRLLQRPSSPAFFLSERGRRVNTDILHQTFHELSTQIGLHASNNRPRPRLHDFRHCFAVRTLLGWYRSGQDVERLMPLLSTYLGHTHVADTYWYISAAPELLAYAGARLERSVGRLP